MATLKELVSRFQQAGTTDEASVLTQEELNDPQTRKLAELAKQNVTASMRSAEIEKRKEEETAAEARQEAEKKERMATAFGLTPEERARYTQPVKTPSVASLPMPAAPSAPVTPEEPVTSKPEEKKEAAVPPPSPGGMPPQAGQPTQEPTGEEDKEQEKKQDTIQSALQDVGKIQAAFGANREPDRKELDSLLKKLDDIKPDTETYRDPVTRNFLQDKAEAFRAYKEKADRNEWLELAQNLVGSLTQFASAQAAIGTGRVGGGLPLPTTDYGRRTEQAFREYQAQAADINAEQRAVEQAQERVDRLRQQKMATERATLGERIGAERERIRQEEAEAKQAGRDALNLYSALQANKRAMEQNEVAVQRALIQHQQRQDSASAKQLDNQIGFLANQENKLQRQLDATNELITADKKQYEGKLANWAAYSGQNVADVVNKAQKESGIFTSKKSYIQETLAPQSASEVQKQLADTRNQLEQLRAAKYGGQPAAQPAPTQPTPPPSTTPARPGKVISAAELEQYAKLHNKSIEYSRDWLQKQGYVIGN